LVWFNQKDETDQIDQIDQMNQMDQTEAILRAITTPRCLDTHTVAEQDEVTNPQAQSRLILLVVDLGCLCGGADLAELARRSPVIHGNYHQSV
jgi:hypothetical protein